MPACPAERRSGASRLPWMRRGQSRTAALFCWQGSHRAGQRITPHQQVRLLGWRPRKHRDPQVTPVAPHVVGCRIGRDALSHASTGLRRQRSSGTPRTASTNMSPARRSAASSRDAKRVAGDRRAVYSGTLPPTVVRIRKPLVDNVSNAPGRPPITLSGQSCPRSCPCRMLFAGISPRRKSPLGVRGSR
jgi:hypothetical protein